MRFKRNLKLEYGLTPLDIAPLVNVVFLLLMFSLFSSALVSQPGANLRLPKTVTSNVITEETATITISSENVVYLNGKIVNSKELAQILKPLATSQKPLLIKADRRSSVGRIADIWELCRNLGIEKINIATDQE